MPKRGYLSEVRELVLQDVDVSDFLKHLGLFSLELKKYLVSRDIKVPQYTGLFQYKPSGKLFEKIAGRHFNISHGYGSGGSDRSRRQYPGPSIYFLMNYGVFDGWARIIYEVLDSKVKTNRVNVLWHLRQGKMDLIKLNNQLTRSPTDMYINVKKLSLLNLISFDGENLELTKTAQRILSPKVERTFEKLKKWKHRIDVWK